MPLKLTNKIIVILSATILFFIITFSICFSLIFVHHADTIENSRLESKALSLADAIGKATPDNAITSIYNNNFLLSINSLNQSELWLIDKNSSSIVGSRYNPHLTYTSLSENEANDIQKIFSGQNIHTNDFQEFLPADFTTIGVPIYDTNGQVKAALLLHDKIPTIQDSWYDGLPIIGICTFILLIISIFLIRIYIRKYILSLDVINNFTQKILNHNYQSQIRTKSQDEIGQLALKLNQLATYLQTMEQEFHSQKTSNTNLMTKTAYKLHENLKDLKSAIALLPTSTTELTKTSENIASPTKKDTIVDKNPLQTVYKNIERLEFLANNMLNLSQLDNNSITIQKELTNILDILSDVINNSKKYAIERHISLKLNIDLENRLLLFAGDPMRLRQMFRETLYKAIQLYPEKSTLIINVIEDTHHYYICMQNNNSEISTKQLSDIFQQFYQTSPVDDTLLNSIELTIARHLATLHHIDLSIEKQNDDYIMFKFTIAK